MRSALPVALLIIAPVIGRGQRPFADIEARISDFTLANGMTFIVCERDFAPVVSFRLYVDVGALEDPPQKSGLAHMFEHVAFKGTSTLGTSNYVEEKEALDRVDAAFLALQRARHGGDEAEKTKLAELETAFRTAQEEAGAYADASAFAAAVQAAGGRGLNAGTAHDSTLYYFELPANALELWFLLESQRFRDPVFREFYKERSVVIQERRLRLEDNPIGALLQETLSTAFRVHGYGRPVIGDLRTLESLTRPDAVAFFRKYYVPANMTAAIVGNVSPARVKKLAQAYFGTLPARGKPPRAGVMEPPQTEQRSLTLRFAGQPMLCMAYHRPDMRDPDAPAYEVLGGLLTEGRSARFRRALVEPGIVGTLRGQVTHPGGKYPNLILFSFTPLPGHTNDEVQRLVVDEFERIKSHGVTEQEVEGAKARFRASFLYQLKDNATVAGQLARWQAMTGSWRNLLRYLEAVAAVRPSDIQRVARRSLNQNNLTIAKVETVAPGSTQ